MPQLIDSVTLNPREIVDLAFQYLDDKQLAKIVQTVQSRLVGALNVYVVRGEFFTSNATVTPVRGDDPPCGPGDVRLTLKQIVEFFAAPGLGYAAGGPIGGFIGAAINFLIYYQQHKTITTSVCSSAAALFPAPLTDQFIKDHVRFKYYLDDWEGLREVRPGQQRWASIDEARWDPANLHVKLPRGLNPEQHCLMTAFCCDFRNWSHNHSRKVRFDILVDALPPGMNGCVDYSVLNRALYDEVIATSIDHDTLALLLKEYGEAIVRSAP